MSPIDRTNATELQPTVPLADTPAPEEAAVSDKPIGPEPNLFVTFVMTNTKGKQRFGRVFLKDVLDLQSTADVVRAEALITAHRKADSVEILSWRLLIG